MNNLYNELTSGTVEYKEDGTYITRPPTSSALRAARGLKQLSDQLVLAQEHANSCQRQVYELTQELTNTQNQLKELQNEQLQSIRESGQQTSDVGSVGGDIPGSCDSSTGSDASETSSSVD